MVDNSGEVTVSILAPCWHEVIALDMFLDVDDTGFVLAGFSLSYDGARPLVRWAAPRRGEANDVYLPTPSE